MENIDIEPSTSDVFNTSVQYIEVGNEISIIENRPPTNNDIMDMLRRQTILMEKLMVEVITVKNELRQLKLATRVGVTTDLLPAFPLTTMDSLTAFDEALSYEAVCTQMKLLLDRVGGDDVAQFLRGAVKKVMTDELATNFSYRGTNNKRSFQELNFIRIIRDACHIKFLRADDKGINKVLQQHFVYAKDRAAKRSQARSGK